jgi:predicted GNAT family N-acyltransferase
MRLEARAGLVSGPTLPSMSAARARAIRTEDITACVELMRGNVPRYFTEGELDDFEGWLAVRSSPFLVIEEGGEIVACGGYHVDESKGEAGLNWGMVRRSEHRHGLGSLLLAERLSMIAREPRVQAVVLDTSQHSRPFYERHGFRAVAETPDGYGPGLDRIDMRLGPG